MAPAGVQGLLALEVPIRRRPSSDPPEVCDLIQEMSRANATGCTPDHGELLKLGIKVAQSTAARYMVKRPRRSGQNWRTFLANRAAGNAAVDLLIMPTIRFKVLYWLVLLAHDRRQLAHWAVTAHPTADWIARQITGAFP